MVKDFKIVVLFGSSREELQYIFLLRQIWIYSLLKCLYNDGQGRNKNDEYTLVECSPLASSISSVFISRLGVGSSSSPGSSILSAIFRKQMILPVNHYALILRHDAPKLYHFTLSNARRFYSSNESAATQWVEHKSLVQVRQNITRHPLSCEKLQYVYVFAWVCFSSIFLKLSSTWN